MCDRIHLLSCVSVRQSCPWPCADRKQINRIGVRMRDDDGRRTVCLCETCVREFRRRKIEFLWQNVDGKRLKCSIGFAIVIVLCCPECANHRLQACEHNACLDSATTKKKNDWKTEREAIRIVTGGVCQWCPIIFHFIDLSKSRGLFGNKLLRSSTTLSGCWCVHCTTAHTGAAVAPGHCAWTYIQTFTFLSLNDMMCNVHRPDKCISHFMVCLSLHLSLYHSHGGGGGCSLFMCDVRVQVIKKSATA